MKDINDLDLPGDARYSESHEWARFDGDELVIGITDYAQDQLGDIVYVELPQVGSSFAAGEEFGTVESVKAASEIYLPVAGEIVAVNDALEGAPETLNADPNGDGWLVRIRPEDPAEFDALLDVESYLNHLKG